VPGDAAEKRTAKAPRRTKPLRRRAENAGDGGRTEAQLGLDLRGTEPEQVRMRFGVVADEMAAGGGLPHDVRAFARVTADKEKGDAGVVAVKKIEEFRRDRRIGSVI